MIKVAIALVVTIGTCVFVCLRIYWECYDRTMWINRRLDKIEDHICKMEDYYKIESEMYYQLLERIGKIERRCEDDGK